MKHSGTISILVHCEDSDESALLVAELELIGYWGKVQTCTSLDEARQLVDTNKPDLLIARISNQSQVQAVNLNELTTCCKAILIQGPTSTASLFTSENYLAIPYRIQDLIDRVRVFANSDLSIAALNKEQAIQSADTEGRYKDLFNRASDAIMLIDYLTHTIIDVNFRATALYGYSEEEFIGMNLLQIIPSDHHMRVHKNTAEMVSAGPAHVLEVGDRVHIKKDGTPIQVSISASLIEYGGRRVFQDIVRDETARIQMEDTLKKANENLLELDRLKSLFIASMSHELRTPLNAIIGFTGMMLQEISGPISDKQQDYLTRVANAGRHLLALISDVIDIAKIEAGKAQPYIEHFDLADLVQEAVEQIRVEAKKKGLHLKIAVPEGVQIATDRRRLLQCLLNYLSNALKYTQQGSISVRVSKLEQNTDEIEIAVSDTGTGIAEVDQARLFQQFSRIDSAITRHTAGTGLGLYLTHKLVTNMLGGHVSVQSELGRGSTFRLHLPEGINQ